MQKKPVKNANPDEMLDDDLNEDLMNDDLLMDDLENDPLLQEAASLLGVPAENKVQEKPVREKPTKKTRQIEKKSSIATKLPTKTGTKPVINKKTMTEFANALIKYENLYEEIGFHTILRKLPKDWNYTEDVIIDLLEVLIEKHTIHTFDMKMTANSLKFYPLGTMQDIPKKKKK